jgi:hypothetical protein
MSLSPLNKQKNPQTDFLKVVWLLQTTLNLLHSSTANSTFSTVLGSISSSQLVVVMMA